MKPLHIFYHVGAMNHYKEVVREQIAEIAKSNLLIECTKVHIGSVGKLDMGFDYLPTVESRVVFNDKIELMFDYDDIKLAEGPTLHNLQNFARVNPNCYVMYMHTKGVSDENAVEPRLSCTRDWRHMMQYFTITKWKDCISKLDEGYEAVGCNWYQHPWPHFSGGFWWATSEAIKKLPDLVIRERLDCEKWIGTVPLKVFCPHSSGLGHYQDRYPPERYIKE